MYEEDHSWSFAAGLFVGALVGAALASLFTPRSGPENRELVMEKGLVLRDRVSDAATSKARDLTATATDKARELTGRADEAATSTAEPATSATEPGGTQASDAASTVSQTPGDIADRAQAPAGVAASTAAPVLDQTEDAASPSGATPSTSGARRYDGASDMVITDTSAVGEVNAAGHALESDEQFQAEGAVGNSATEPFSTLTSSGTSGGGEMPGANQGSGEA